MAKKWREEYQLTDPDTGVAIGPKQVFEADTQAELIEKLKAAHQNASTALYRTRQAAKLGALTNIDPDPDMPVRTYEETVLSADDRVKMAKALADPANTPHVIKKLLESFGIPTDAIREMLQERENQKRIDFAQQQAALFAEAHPEYIGSEFNNDRMLKYLNKNNMACTKKNLEIAYADLTSQGLLTIQQPVEQTSTVVPAATVEPEPAAAPATEPTITATATTDAPISAAPTEVRPKSSSSGLSSRGSSAASAAGAAPKAVGITAQDVLKMTSEAYDRALQRGLFNEKGEQTMTASEFKKFVDSM